MAGPVSHPAGLYRNSEPDPVTEGRQIFDAQPGSEHASTLARIGTTMGRMPDASATRGDAWLRARVLVTVAAGIVFAILVVTHVPRVNGPDYWQWPWQRRGDVLLVAILLLVATSPALAAQFVRSRAVALVLLGFTVVLLQFTGNQLQPGRHGEARIEAIAHDQLQTSYFTVAESIVKAPGIDWLGEYDELLKLAPQHATTKPPGPVAFYVLLIRLAGAARAPLVIAVALSLLSACGVAAAWWMVRTITGDDETGRIAATLLALSPSMTLFFLYLDPVYPILSCALVALWFRALEGDRRRDAVFFGLVLFLATMTSYTLLVLGLPLAAITATRLVRRGALRRLRILELVAIAIGVAVTSHALFALVTGFNPISAFRTALAMQAYQLPLLHRPWPKTIPFDLLDFFLGAGWVPLVPALWWVTKHRDVTAWTFLTPFVVAVTGLIQAETARVWIFLLPLLFLPASLELRTWSERQRIAVYMTMVVVLVALYTNMRFIG